MRITKELSRIKDHGFKVNICWGISIEFEGVSHIEAYALYRAQFYKQKSETWEQCLYNAILKFDDRFPELT